MRLQNLILLTLFAIAACPSLSASLTIYRIGGESLPEPDPEALGVPEGELRFEQLDWETALAPPFGNTRLVVIEPDSVRPDFVPRSNLMPQVIDRGGFIRARTYFGRNHFVFDPEMGVIYDGDPLTAYPGQVPNANSGKTLRTAGAPFCIGRENGVCKYVWVVLDGAFPLQQVRIYPRPENQAHSIIPTYTLGTNDGDPNKFGFRDRSFGGETLPGGSIDSDFNLFTEVFANNESLLEFEIGGEPVQEVIFIAPVGDWEIAEFELIFEGFAVEANYTSGLIPLDVPSTLGRLRWSGSEHPGSQVDLRIRAGNSPDPNIYYRNTFRGPERSRFTAEGLPLDRVSYFRMEPGEQAGLAPDLDNWTHWSENLPFELGEASFGQTSPRLFVQLEADFSAGGRLDYVEFAATQPPVITGSAAEIVPQRVSAGQIERFTYLINPDISVGDQGFDTIEIETPTRVERVISVTIDGQELGSSDWHTTIADERFAVHIPPMDDTNTGDLVKIVFDARVFDFGTVFTGWVSDSLRPWEMAQGLAPGDADFLAESNSLTVELLDVGTRTLGALGLSTPVVTPNDDGANDELRIDFSLHNLSREVPIVVDIFDMSGRWMARLPTDPLGSGPHQVNWNGRGPGGDLLPPGIYVIVVVVDTDESTFSSRRVVALVY